MNFGWMKMLNFINEKLFEKIKLCIICEVLFAKI